jgi:hypothetical protein
MINGLPQGVTPLELTEVEVGTTIIRVQKAGYEPWEETHMLEGGKSEVARRRSRRRGPVDDQLKAQQRGLSSWGARTLPRGRSTVDISLGYPYFFDVRVAVGAGKKSGRGFDANVGVRSMIERSEIGLGARFSWSTTTRSRPACSATCGGARSCSTTPSATARRSAPAASRRSPRSPTSRSAPARLEFWSDRHCPELKADGVTFDGDAIATCEKYLHRVGGPGDGSGYTAEQAKRLEDLTGESGSDFFSRDGGVRLITAVIAEIALRQRWNLWVMLEGAPFQSERALFVDDFNAPMLTTDYNTYARVGATYKF